MTKVALIEDDELVRAGLSDWLASVSGITVLHSVGSAGEALKLFQNECPEIALVDVLLPGMSGIQLVSSFRERWPHVQSIMLSGACAHELVLDAFEAGARGYLPKLTSVEELQRALAEVQLGRCYLSPTVAEAVLEKALELREIVRSSGPQGEAAPELTDRDRELLKLIAEGHTFSEIALRLNMSSRSVERMKAKLEEKLKAGSLADLVRKAVEFGLVAG